MTAVNQRGGRQSKRQHQEAVELTFPLEAEVGDGILPHMHKMVGCRNIHSAPITGVAEQCATLPLKGFPCGSLLHGGVRSRDVRPR